MISYLRRELAGLRPTDLGSVVAGVGFILAAALVLCIVGPVLAEVLAASALAGVVLLVLVAAVAVTAVARAVR